ncbi:Uncharacterised protein (plasmid) [Tsukamurella tyrosinosolvens]|uniref:DUF1542 domain-containing protein n=1 Tax=Tsukamurella tyrosinosolvens TaxID=57704 RepID=A0A1H4IBV5_TSUTY|nr:hypothetical protein [Tsukamurella tyrosinosolvens]KXO98077.1 hypothetical protein AXK58_25640 [Tsukamurella tyrosinosolvens]SEB31400.1 hypothetical protein SAMN04489793_0221 [Tsukamurella tyrosinosolvens]VEH95138.1 Uncharacterised protein [Tsukamurella tyrosinosolvens]
MDPVLILIAVAVIALIVVLVIRGNRNRTTALADAQADARAAIDRLAGQVNNLVGSNDAARQALADAGERYTAAGAQVGGANTPAQARLAKQTALEGLYYARAARVAMDLDPGPPIPELDGQRTAGAVTEDRTVDVDGRALTASPSPSDRTPNYYPGGTVAGRPVPAGWYSEPWWKPALVAGAWGVGSYLLFSSMFAGMAGVGPAVLADPGVDGAADAGGDVGSDGGFDGGGFDGGGFGDFGGGDFGGGDFGGF